MIFVSLQITSSLQMELNRLYASFVARNPYFEANGGRVSIVAHSLGEKCIPTNVFMYPIHRCDVAVQSFCVSISFNDCQGNMPSSSQCCVIVYGVTCYAVQVSERNCFFM